MRSITYWIQQKKGSVYGNIPDIMATNNSSNMNYFSYLCQFSFQVKHFHHFFVWVRASTEKLGYFFHILFISFPALKPKRILRQWSDKENLYLSRAARKFNRQAFFSNNELFIACRTRIQKVTYNKSQSCLIFLGTNILVLKTLRMDLIRMKNSIVL